MENNGFKLSTDNYKGVRDFYPDDMALLNYIFGIWKKTVESFGYSEYGASVLEPAEIYKAKSGEEIVNEQTYTFKDRGDREVTLRPEMTPTVARMIAAKRREISFPARWYSIPNVFRYERPQKGRLREHWQLNADIFGVSSLSAETEMIELASTLLKNFGFKSENFEIRINSRKNLNDYLSSLGLDDIQKIKITKLIDKKDKIDDFDVKVKEITDKEIVFSEEIPSQVKELMSLLNKRGIENVVYSPALVRGFDYYTDIVFEVFDKNPENRRSVFGGGRYDNLSAIFGEPDINVVGFGIGDVIVADMLKTYGLVPKLRTGADLYVCVIGAECLDTANNLANTLRAGGIKVAVDYSDKKVGDQISKASKSEIPFIVCVGQEEIKSGKFRFKMLSSGQEKKLKPKDAVNFIRKNI